MTYGTITFGPVLIAATAVTRFVGLRPWPVGAGALIAGASVHGRGMVEPLTLVGLDAASIVVATCRLDPGHFVTIAGASTVLELPSTVDPPGVGEQITITPVDLSRHDR